MKRSASVFVIATFVLPSTVRVTLWKNMLMHLARRVQRESLTMDYTRYRM